MFAKRGVATSGRGSTGKPIRDLKVRARVEGEGRRGGGGGGGEGRWWR
jgi:hypothetical protein